MQTRYAFFSFYHFRFPRRRRTSDVSPYVVSYQYFLIELLLTYFLSVSDDAVHQARANIGSGALPVSELWPQPPSPGVLSGAPPTSQSQEIYARQARVTDELVPFGSKHAWGHTIPVPYAMTIGNAPLQSRDLANMPRAFDVQKLRSSPWSDVVSGFPALIRGQGTVAQRREMEQLVTREVLHVLASRDEDEEAGALEIGPLPRILYGLPSHFGSLLPPFQATRRRDVGHLETAESAARDGYNPRIIEVNIGGTKVDELA